MPGSSYQVAINSKRDTNRVEYNPIPEASTRQAPALLPRYPQQRSNRKLDARERELGPQRARERHDLSQYRT
jgi:hypothetical protein